MVHAVGARPRASKALRLLIAAILALGLIPIASLSSGGLLAAETAYIQHDGKIPYAGYSTMAMSVDGSPAVCAQPSKATPPEGSYAVSYDLLEGSDALAVEPGSTWRIDLIRNLFWYGPGSPGFNAGFWPSSWYDGTPMTYERYFVALHIALSDAYAADWQGSVYGCNEQMKTWARTQIIGYQGSGKPFLAGSTYDKYFNSGWTEAPSDFQVFQMATGSSTQRVFSFRPYNPEGWVGVAKRSANPEITDGNSCYDLGGAQYAVYDSSWSHVDTITVPADGGWAYSQALAPGVYHVQETVAPKGYALDQTVFDVTVTSKQTSWIGDAEGYHNEVPQNDPAVMWVGKIDLETTLDMPQGSASLAGAQFTVRYYDGYYDTPEAAEASGAPTRTWVVETNENGYARILDEFKIGGDEYYYIGTEPTIPLGTVLIQETKAPEGYLLDDDTVYLSQVTADSFVESVETYNAPIVKEQAIRGGLEVEKRDSQTGSTPQGDATFAGIEFEVVNDSEGSVRVGGRDVAPGDVALTLTTGADGKARTASDALPYGDYLVRESATNGSYLNTSVPQTAQIRQDGVIVRLAGPSSFTDDVVRGGVEVEKRDAETGRLEPLGAGSLDVLFEITNAGDRPVVVGGVSYAPGKAVMTIQAKGGVAKTASDALPYGSYEIREVSAGTGYFLTDGEPRPFSIERNGVIVKPATGEFSFKNQAKRGDLELVKVEEGTMHRLAGVPFRITSQTTGESHVIVTDANGYASTHASWNPHTQKTNANDAAGEGALDDEAGVWFGLGSAPDDSKGALPYDRYTLEELPCAANEGLTLVTIPDITITRDSHTVDLGTVDDDRPVDQSPRILTTAMDAADRDKLVSADGAAVIVDSVEYANLVPGETYRLVATLMDKATGEPVTQGGEPVTGERELTPREHYGTADVRLALDARGLKGDVVVFEELWAADGTLAASHADIDDEGQTVRLVPPEIGTQASDGADGDKLVVADPEAVVVDTVSYANLVPGREYLVTGTLMVRQTGEPLLAADGEPVTATLAFKPSAASGSVELEFRFDASLLAGKELVAFETLEKDGLELAVHADIDDEGQTVEVAAPEIGTTARDAEDGDKALAASPVAAVIDEVAYEGLVAGKSYVLTATLMDKATGEPLAGADGQPVTASTAFKPAAAHGSAEVTLELDASALPEGAELVVFEELARDGIVVAEHKDIDDEGQTVSVERPGIGTQASDGADGDKEVAAGPEAVIVDEVAYEGLVPGREYLVTGTLMLKSTGEPLLAADGEPVTATKAFVPAASSGTVEVEFRLDTSLLAGEELVAFEGLSEQGVELAVHADIDDEGQTVEVVSPSIATTARDALDGDKAVTADPGAKVVDTLSLTGLAPGRDYEAHGILMDAETGLPAVAAGSEAGEEELAEAAEAIARAMGLGEEGDGSVDRKALAAVLAEHKEAVADMAVAKRDVTPEGTSATVELEYPIDASGLAGTTTVCLAVLVADDRVVASELDLSCAEQQCGIVAPAIGTELTDKTDGDHEALDSAEAVLVDTVAYRDLVPGKEYVLAGILMDKATGKPLLVADREVRASATFVPNAPDGTAEVEFAFDARGLKGHELVAFETLSKDGLEVAVHADIDDAAQTVTITDVPGAPGQSLAKTGDGTAIATLIAFLAVLAGGLGAWAARRRMAPGPEEPADE